MPMNEKRKTEDWVAVLGKGLFGAIPVVGPLAAEVIGTLIPNQRLDRIEGYLKKVEEKLKNLKEDQLREKFTDQENIDLFEDSLYQASKALSEERKEYIASLFKNCLTDEKLGHIQYKKLLSILSEINDIEILILKGQEEGYRGNSEFWKKHEKALMPPPVSFGSTQEDQDKNSIHQTYKNNLVKLGLFRPNFKKPKKGEIPEFDEKTGMIKAQGYDITPLGRLLLKSINQIEKE